MTLYEFTANDADKQIEIVNTLGVHIGSRDQPDHYIHLYQIETFYAEIFFRKNDNTIWKVGGFDHPVLLQPYLNQIDIRSLGLK